VLSLSTDIWYLKYEYDVRDRSELPHHLTTDTVLVYNGTTVRTFQASIADTLEEQGLKRSELKIYMDHPSNIEQAVSVTEGLRPEQTNIVETRVMGNKKNKRPILYYLLFGFVSGSIVDLILRRKSIKA
jgi:hypothetical protein